MIKGQMGRPIPTTRPMEIGRSSSSAPQNGKADESRFQKEMKRKIFERTTNPNVMIKGQMSRPIPTTPMEIGRLSSSGPQNDKAIPDCLKKIVQEKSRFQKKKETKREIFEVNGFKFGYVCPPNCDGSSKTAHSTIQEFGDPSWEMAGPGFPGLDSEISFTELNMILVNEYQFRKSTPKVRQHDVNMALCKSIPGEGEHRSRLI